MRKQEFLDALRARLCGLPARDIEEQIAFWEEMIDDRIEEGSTEEEAVSDVGTVDRIAEQIIADIPLPRIAKEKIRPKRKIRAWEIVLLFLGSPVWLSLGVAALAVLLSLYAVVWSGIVSLWAVFGSLAAGTLGGIASGIALACVGKGLVGVAVIGMGIFCAGLSIFAFFGCKAATKGTCRLTKKMILGIKKRFVGKGEAA